MKKILPILIGFVGFLIPPNPIAGILFGLVVGAMTWGAFVWKPSDPIKPTDKHEQETNKLTNHESPAYQVGTALVEVVKVALDKNKFYNEQRQFISVDVQTFSNELTAFSLSAVKAVIQSHGTHTEVLTGFEDQIEKDFPSAINGIYLSRSQEYIRADQATEPGVINFKTPGDLLSVRVAKDAKDQLTIGTIFNISYWTGMSQGAAMLLKQTGFLKSVS